VQASERCLVSILMYNKGAIATAPGTIASLGVEPGSKSVPAVIPARSQQRRQRKYIIRKTSSSNLHYRDFPLCPSRGKPTYMREKKQDCLGAFGCSRGAPKASTQLQALLLEYSPSIKHLQIGTRKGMRARTRSLSERLRQMYSVLFGGTRGGMPSTGGPIGSCPCAGAGANASSFTRSRLLYTGAWQ